MTIFELSLCMALVILGLGFGLYALVVWTGPCRHHDHLIPRTPRRARG